MNKKLIVPLLTALSILLLSACSVLTGLIPDQKVEVLGTQEELILPEVPLALEAPAVPEKVATEIAKALPDIPGLPTNLTPQASNTYISFGFYRSVEDLKEAIALAPKNLNQELPLSKLTFTGAAEGTVFPDKVGLDLEFVLLSLWDGFAGEEAEGFFGWAAEEAALDKFLEASDSSDAVHTAATVAQVVMTKDASCSIESCIYNLDAASSQNMVLALGADKIAKVLSLISPDGTDDSVNSVSISGTFKLLTEMDESVKAQLTFDTPDAVISFKDGE